MLITDSKGKIILPDTPRSPAGKAGSLSRQQQPFSGCRADCQLAGETEIIFITGEMPAKSDTRWTCDKRRQLIVLNLAGPVGLFRWRKTKPVTLSRLECCSFASPGTFSLCFEKGAQRLLIVSFPAKNTPGLPAPVAAMLAGEKERVPMSLSMLAATESLALCRLEGEAGVLFLSSQLLALAALLADAYRRKKTPAYRYCKTEYDLERITFAREYLLRHYDVPPSLKELARIAGINEYKLKRAFREVYGNSVFGYLTDYKMELARRELENGQRTASELAYDLGYSSLQHFSKTFRKKFGYPPGTFRK